MISIVRMFACCAALTLSVAAMAQASTEYPSRAVRIIVPFAVGGPTDIMARLMAQKLADSAGKHFYVENVPGAGGNIGMGQAASAAPDGHTILFVSSSYVVNPSLYRKVPYDALKDFAPVTLAATTPNMLSIHPSTPAKNVEALINLVRANPGKYNYASPGAGTTSHLSAELFRLSFNLDLVHVPFNGTGPAIASAVSGHTPILFAALSPQVPHIKGGQLRALAVTSARRSAVVPDVPTMAEAGLLNHQSETMQGVLVPAATPNAIVNLLHRELVKITAMPDIRQRFDALGFEPVANTPGEFFSYIKAEIAKWERIIRQAGINPQ
jgi:tripartite-type tricarboxylate transporter receptor subunit TctC